MPLGRSPSEEVPSAVAFVTRVNPLPLRAQLGHSGTVSVTVTAADGSRIANATTKEHRFALAPNQGSSGWDCKKV